MGDCEEFEVLETDPYYKSIDGCIYSKDGKRLEAVPYGRKEIDIAEGCETIDVQSYSYNIEAYINGKLERYIYGGCGQIEKFVFPSTFKSVQGSISAYHNHSDFIENFCAVPLGSELNALSRIYFTSLGIVSSAFSFSPT